MLGAADVQVHRHPALDGVEVEGLVVLIGAAEAQEVPAGTGEAAQGVGLATPGLAAVGAGGAYPILGCLQRRSSAQLLWIDLFNVGQQDR